MKRYLSVLMILLVFAGYPQAKLDSLRKVYKDPAVPDTERLKALNDFAWSLYRNDPDTAILLANEQIALAQRIPRGAGKKWEAKALSTIAACYNLEGHFPDALEYYTRSLKVRQEIGDLKGVANCYGNIGFVHKQLSDFTKALEYYLKALKIHEEIKNKDGIGYCYNNIGLIYSNEFNYTKALEYYKKALQIQQELDNKQDEASSYINIGGLYYLQTDTAKALEYYNKALVIGNEVENKTLIASCYNNIGLVSADRGKFKEALDYYLRSLRLKVVVGNQQGIATSYTNIADLYVKLQDFKKAIQYGDSSIRMSREVGDIDNERLAYKGLSLAYARTGRFKEAYESHIRFKALTDSIFNVENSKQIGDMKTRFEVEKKEAELNAEAEARQAINVEEKKRQQFVIYAVVAVLLIVIVFSLLLYKRFRLTSRQKQIIEVKSRETEEQKHLVEEKQKEIIESITYAKRLQEAILPPREFINEHIPENFVLYKPKDIVAGDFYWAEAKDNLFFLAAADSTGHGVPGAMVSVICSGSLNRAVNEFNLRNTGAILDKTRELVLETFAKSGSDVKDGMDVSLLCIDKTKRKIYWSGANNPLWYILPGAASVSEVKADKQPIGKTDHPKPFTGHELPYTSGAVFYLFTDGYADQFGGPQAKKFKYKQLEELLLANHSQPMQEQAERLLSRFEEWRGALEQVDDVCIIGIRI